MATAQVSYPDEVKEMDGSIKDVESTGSYVDKAFERRTMRRVDLRVLPLLIAVYSLCLMDRINLGFARVAGMDADLKLSEGERYSIVSVVYFPTYILLELPSNLVLRRLGPRICLSFITVAWGAIQLAEGFVPAWGYLALCRTLLGAGEAGFFPAVVYIISTWYTRFEVQKRLAALYLSAAVIQGFSSILAYAMSLLKGKGGLNSWQWIFVIEGVATMFLGILVFLFVTDFPDQNKFLTPKQTELVLKRIEEDRGDSVPDQVTFKKVLKHLGDWKIWVFGLMFMTQAVPLYFVGFFLSIILKAMGWDLRDSLLLSAPPYGVAFVCATIFAYLSDKQRKRAPYIAAQNLITITGLFITAYHPNANIRYLGLFFVTAGTAGCIPGVLAYAANNVTSQTKRAVSSAVIIAFGGVGGIIATTVFRQKDFPRYIPGLWVTIGLQFFNLAMLLGSSIAFARANKAVRDGKAEHIEGRAGFYYTI